MIIFGSFSSPVKDKENSMNTAIKCQLYQFPIIVLLLKYFSDNWTVSDLVHEALIN